MIKTVFLDMDEVLVDFNKGICKKFGLEYDYNTFYNKYNWFAEAGLNRDKEVNNACTIDFWKNLDWMHDGKEILKLVTKYFRPEQIYLFTMPMPNPGSATGKTLWVEKHMPEFKKRLIITQAPKSLFAKPDTLLVDDKNENVKDFVVAGGKAMLVPRPWNKLHEQADKTIESFEVGFEILQDMRMI